MLQGINHVLRMTSSTINFANIVLGKILNLRNPSHTMQPLKLKKHQTRLFHIFVPSFNINMVTYISSLCLTLFCFISLYYKSADENVISLLLNIHKHECATEKDWHVTRTPFNVKWGGRIEWYDNILYD